ALLPCAVGTVPGGKATRSSPAFRAPRTLRTEQCAKSQCALRHPRDPVRRIRRPDGSYKYKVRPDSHEPAGSSWCRGGVPRAGAGSSHGTDPVFGRATFLYGEFDPGSGRTLAVCLKHASRTVIRASARGSVANG